MAGSDDDFLPISERPEWGPGTGAAPRPPPPQAQPVVAIERDDLTGDMMDYFWGAVAADERSERVYALTGEIIRDLNSSNYTVWEWRWRCLEALGGPAAHAAEEKALMRSVATADPKNYQLWNHRRRLALALGPGRAQAEEELDFAAACLAHDAKNYHAWAHRQAVLLAVAAAAAAAEGAGPLARDAAALWAAELDYTERLLEEDVRNNSAWSQRIFVLRNAPAGAAGAPAEAYDREVGWAAAQLRRAPHNESAWEALRGLAAWGEQPGAPRHALAADGRYLEVCREVLGAHPGCAPALALLADVLLAQASLLGEAAAAAEAAGAAGAAPAAAEASAAAAGGQALDRRHATAAAAEARRLARLVLERLAVADPLKRPYLRLELAALAAGA